MLTALAAFLAVGPLAAAQSDSNWADLRQKAADLLKRARVAEAERLLTAGIAAARGQDETNAGFAEALSDLGALHHESARLSEAERVYKKSLSVWGRITGVHPNSAVILGNFAALRLTQGRPSDALKLYRRAEHVPASSYGASSPRAAWVSCGLADVYWAMGRYEDAKQTIERVSADLELHGHHMELAMALFLRAKIAWRESQLPEAAVDPPGN